MQKTLQLFNVIAQLRSGGGRFSVNWGVLGVRGKVSVRIGAEGVTFPYRSDGHAGHRARFINHVGGCSSRLAAVQKVGAARKMRPHGRTLLLLCLLNARLATARLIDQCGLAAIAILTTPSLDRRLAGNLVLDHCLANRQAVFQTILYHGKLDVIRIRAVMQARVEHGVGTAHGICASPLTSRGLGNAELRGEGTMTDPLLEDLDGALPNLGRMRASPCCL